MPSGGGQPTIPPQWSVRCYRPPQQMAGHACPCVISCAWKACPARIEEPAPGTVTPPPPIRFYLRRLDAPGGRDEAVALLTNYPGRLGAGDHTWHRPYTYGV